MTSEAWELRTNADFLVELYRLNSEIDTREGQTVHRKIISDPSRGIRRAEHIETWSRLRELGHGGFGTVYLEKLQKDGAKKLRAVKELRKNFHSNQGQEFLRELMHMAYFAKDQACFPDFQGWFEDDQTIYLAMEYFEHGDLWQCVQKPLPENETQHIIFQVTEALIMLHSKDITHRDLKPENVFVIRKGPDWWVKLGDFGISKRVKGDETALYTRYLGPYIAPEVNEYLDLDDDSDDDSVGTYTSAVDIWSLGCLAYWLLSKQTPFHAPKSLGRYCKGKIQFPVGPVKDRLSAEGLTFVQSCLKVRPLARPSADDAINLPWLKEVSKSTSMSTQDNFELAEVSKSLDFGKKDSKPHDEEGQAQAGVADENPVRRLSVSTVGHPVTSKDVVQVKSQLASLEQPGPSEREETPSPSSFHRILDDMSSSVDQLSIQSVPGHYPELDSEDSGIEERGKQHNDNDDNDEHQETVKARDKPVHLAFEGPTIHFTPIANLQGPSLMFPEVRRTLPRPSSTIRIGRYSERHKTVEAMPSTPSDATISFKSKVVSRRHCEISYKDGQWFLRDVGSSSGTFLNNVRLGAPNTRSSPWVIHDGDRIQLGIDFRGGHDEFYRCVRIRVQCTGSPFPRSVLAAQDLIADPVESATSADISKKSSTESHQLDKIKGSTGRREMESASLYSSVASLLREKGAMDDTEIAKLLSLLEERKISLDSNEALHWATRRNDLKIVKIILDMDGESEKGNPNYEHSKKVDSIEEQSGMAALHIAANNDSLDVLILLLEKGANIEIRDVFDHHTALHMAARQGHKHVIGILLDKGASIESFTAEGLTPLHITAQEGHLDALKLLVSWGANVDARTYKQSTPIGLASWRGHEGIVKFLCEKHASLEATNSLGRSPLMLATISNSLSIAKLLLAKGALVDQSDHAGQTPLCAAAVLGNADILPLLLAAGADVNARDHNGSTAATMAKERKDRRAMAILKDYDLKESPHGISGRIRSVFSKK